VSPSDGGSEVRAQSSARKLAAIVGLFMAIGPPIGGVTIVASVGELIVRKQLNLEALTRFVQELSYIFPAMPLDYLFGLLPAALAGIIVGTAQLKYGRLALPVVLVIGAVVGVVYYFSAPPPENTTHFVFPWSGPHDLRTVDVCLLGSRTKLVR